MAVISAALRVWPRILARTASRLSGGTAGVTVTRLPAGSAKRRNAGSERPISSGPTRASSSVMRRVASSTFEFRRSSTRLNPRKISARNAFDCREMTTTFSRPVSRLTLRIFSCGREVSTGFIWQSRRLEPSGPDKRAIASVGLTQIMIWARTRVAAKNILAGPIPRRRRIRVAGSGLAGQAGRHDAPELDRGLNRSFSVFVEHAGSYGPTADCAAGYRRGILQGDRISREASTGVLNATVCLSRFLAINQAPPRSNIA